MTDPERAGKFIAECRKEKQMTQKQLGEKLGVTDRAVSKWETGRAFPDISLLEPLCQELGISVSEFLAGKKIEPEQYQEETEKMLLASISGRQLYGMQAVLYLLSLIGITMVWVPFLADSGRTFLPRLNIQNILCWVSAAAVTGITAYLDKKIPERKFRVSNPWMEVAAGFLYFTALVFMNFHNAGGITAMIGEPVKNRISVAAIVLSCLILTVGIRWILANIHRKEWEQENRDNYFSSPREK